MSAKSPPPQGNAADLKPGPRTATLLTARGGSILTKRFKKSKGGRIACDSYDRALEYDHEQVPFGTPEEIVAVLETVQANQCIIRGTPRPGREGKAAYRRIRKHGDVDPDFEDKPKAWGVLDIDGLEPDGDVDLTSAKAVGEYVMDRAAPAEIADAAFVCQLSASHGVGDSAGKIKCHIFFTTDNPVEGWELALWTEGTPADAAVHRPVQPIYIAPPIFEGMPDPAKKRLAHVAAVDGKPDAAPVPFFDRKKKPKDNSGLEGDYGEEFFAAEQARFLEAGGKLSQPGDLEAVAQFLRQLNPSEGDRHNTLFYEVYPKLYSRAIAVEDWERLLDANAKWWRGATSPEQALRLRSMEQEYGCYSQSADAGLFAPVEKLPERTEGDGENEGSGVEPYEVLTGRALFDKKPIPYLVKRTIPESSLGLIFGKHGSHKTFLAIYTAYNWALGRDVFGLPSRLPRRVLYIAAEGASGMKKRLYGFIKHHGLSEDDMPFDLLPHAPQVFSPDDMARLAATIARGNYGMIIYDTASRAMTGADENSQQAMTVFIHEADKLRRVSDAAVIGVHHENAEGGMRGSTVLPGGVDWIWHTQMAGDSHVKVTMDKIKEDAMWTTSKFLMVRPVVLDDWCDEDGEPYDTRVLEFDPTFRPYASDGDRLLTCIADVMDKFARNDYAATFPEVSAAAKRLGLIGLSDRTLRDKFDLGHEVDGTDNAGLKWKIRVVERPADNNKTQRWLVAERYDRRANLFVAVDNTGKESVQ